MYNRKPSTPLWTIALESFDEQSGSLLKYSETSFIFVSDYKVTVTQSFVTQVVEIFVKHNFHFR